MNDDFESILAQLQPARMSPPQRTRLHAQIAARLEQPARPGWQLWVGWSSAVAAAIALVLTLATTNQPVRRALTTEHLLASNVWFAPVHDPANVGSSNVRENQFFFSTLDSNRLQSLLLVGWRSRKI